MKILKIKKKDPESIDSVVEFKSRFGIESNSLLLSQAETLWHSFGPFRRHRARVTRFVYEDQWGDLINVNGKTMTQREYLAQTGNVVLQANLMVSKANSIVGSHIKEGGIPSIKARRKSQQQLAEILSEGLHANWDTNDMNELEVLCEQELLFGGMAVIKESFERMDGIDDAWSRAVNPNMFAFQSSMQDPRLKDISMTVELHDYTFNEMCAAFVTDFRDMKTLREWYGNASSPLYYNDLIDVSKKLDSDRLDFYHPIDSHNCRVIEIWTKERRPRYHVFDPQTAEYYDINEDDTAMLAEIELKNSLRLKEAAEHNIDPSEYDILIELHPFVDTYWYFRFLTPTGYILLEGESDLPGRGLPYTVCAVPFVNGKICGFLSDAVDLQMALNRELVVYDWMKRLDTKGVTFVPQSIIPDGMDYSTFAEQWTSMDGIVFYKPTPGGDRPFVEHGGGGRINTAEMVKMLSDTMSESVSVSGAIQGKTPYAGTSAQLYAQQKENSTTPIAVIMDKLENFIKHVAIKKTQFIQMYYNVNQFAEVAENVENIDWNNLDLTEIQNLEFRFKYVITSDHTSLRQETNDLLLQMMQTGALTAADVLDLGEFANADVISQRLREKAEAAAQQQQVGADYENKQQLFRVNS